TKNHAATTAAPMHPAITPSLSTEPRSRSMATSKRHGSAGSEGQQSSQAESGIAGQAYAVIRVPQVRWQRGAVGERAPRVGVAPGAAAADTAGAALGTERIFRWGPGVVRLVEPVGTPLVTDPGKVGEAERVGRRGGDLGRGGEARGDRRVAPRPARAGGGAPAGRSPLPPAG